MGEQQELFQTYSIWVEDQDINLELFMVVDYTPKDGDTEIVAIDGVPDMVMMYSEDNEGWIQIDGPSAV